MFVQGPNGSLLLTDLDFQLLVDLSPQIVAFAVQSVQFSVREFRNPYQTALHFV